MPKEMTVDPRSTMVSSNLTIPAIPIHAYRRSLAEERAARGDGDLVEILRHMMLVREFENLLGGLKSKGEYAGIELKYRGPAHLSVGQEGLSVGSAWGLEPDDHIFGSHRSHGEFIAKSLRTIRQLPADRLAATMERDRNKALLRVVETHLPGSDDRDFAENFALFGLLAEILMRADGFNGGMGGSMHAFFTPLGVYPNNAIVGASAGIATGAALYKKLHGSGIAVANVGDGATGCGLVWESMNFAAMAQYRNLWEDTGHPPVLFLFGNNFYAMGGQTRGETMGWDRLSRIGAGLRDDALNAETVDGTNPLAVADAVVRKRDLLIKGRGPALLDVECYRSAGHSTTDVNAYRTRDELEAWNAFDPIARLSASLVGEGVVSAGGVEDVQAAAIGKMTRLLSAAADPATAAPVDIESEPALIGGYVFSNTVTPAPGNTPLASLADKSPRLRQLARRARFGLSEDGEKLSPMRTVTLRDGLFEAIAQRMLDDDRLIAYGEECREWGGAFGVYRGLTDIMPRERLFNAPISEAAIVSTAVGYAMEGGRALVELMYGDFIGRAGDEIFNQLAKWQAMSAGELRLPVVLRCSLGSRYGAQHSQDWSALIAHIPGLKVVYPATPYDAKGLMGASLAGDDPVVFFESQRLYDIGEVFNQGGVPTESYELPLGRPEVRRSGDDLTVLTIGPSLYPALEAAETLKSDRDVSCEIVDARTLVPFDYAPLVESIERTGRLMIVSEACERGSFAMTLAANAARFAGAALKTPVRVLGTPNWIVPGAEMEATYFPNRGDIVALVEEVLGLVELDSAARAEAMRRARLGI